MDPVGLKCFEGYENPNILNSAAYTMQHSHLEKDHPITVLMPKNRVETRFQM